MAKNFMEKRYSPEDALKTLEFLQSAVDSVLRDGRNSGSACRRGTAYGR